MTVNGQKVAKQKTHVKTKCHDAVFNESFSFKLTDDSQLENVAFQLLILNHDGVTRNEIVGQCTIGAHSPQFLQVRQAPQKQIAEWYTIQQPA